MKEKKFYRCSYQNGFGGLDADMLQIKAYLVQREQGIISQFYEDFINKMYNILNDYGYLEGDTKEEKMEDCIVNNCVIDNQSFDVLYEWIGKEICDARAEADGDVG